MADADIKKLPLNDEDDEILAQLGHTQELRRDYSIWSLGALCLCLMATWEALSTVIATALSTGGAPCLFFNLLLSVICTMAISLSLGEIASIYPTAGGQYHWVAALSPPSTRSVAAWSTGWINLGGQIVLTASAAFAAGLQMQGMIVLNNESYVPARWQGLLLYWAVLVYAASMNIWGSRLLPTANLLAGVLHVAGLFAVLIVLGVLAPKNTASFVFTEVSNSSGWSSDGVSWLVGLISAVYPLLGYDAACHLAEEMPHASRNVPLAMVGSTLVNGILGLGYSIMLLFSTGPLEALLTTPTGFPFMQIFLDGTKSPVGATVMSAIIDIIAITASVAGVTSTSRTLWAFARDKATPFDRYFSYVDHKSQIPVRAVVIVTVLQMLLGFIYLGNSTAFNAILSMAVLGLYASYLIPIVYFMIHGRPNFTAHDFGVFKLPKRLGLALNLLACAWLILAMVFSTFPTSMPVTPQNMNYSTVVMVGWVVLGGVYYLVSGRHKFKVPVVDREARGF
ncbi:amino acid permease [Cucurbitaria berberidis CBS 394.84]|uniref:Amino acid permease n=1 Tax=Cucurbitaria berberidis CBS 394.84 TaxID=1168544 RepID=A0A9P4GLV0_9PLEO|nr:amino acid permease [Cucurbitaria berberidis CBS 394.84]KAF1847965.1 amino acid permease [Cucurbitaria berberidis CBS 394.84]